MTTLKIPEHYEMEKRLREMTGKNVRFGGNFLDPKDFSCYVHLIYRDMDTKKKILLEKAQDAWADSGDINTFYEHLKDQILSAVAEIDAEEAARTPEQKQETVRYIEKIIDDARRSK